PGPTISQVRHRLDELRSQQDRAIQLYDQAVQSLADARQHLVAAQREVSKAHAQLTAVHTQIVQIAVAAYENSYLQPTAFGAPLTNPAPEAAWPGAPLLQPLPGNQGAERSGVIATARHYTAAKQAARRTKAAVTALAQQRLRQQKAVAATIATQK